MDNHGFVEWVHDCRRHGHVLNGKSGAVGRVVFTALRTVVEIFFHLDWRTAQLGDGVDTGEPLDTPAHGASQYNYFCLRMLVIYT